MSENKHISEDEIRKDSPILFELERTSVEAPDGYFEGLPDDIWNKIESSKVHQLPKRNKRVYWAIAAGIAILLGVFLSQISGDVIERMPIELSDLDINYEEDAEYLLAFDDELLLDVYAEVYTEETDAEIDFLIDEEYDYEGLN